VTEPPSEPWLPLDGLRIIELSTYVAGPSAAMALAQLGADVIRVDPIGGATDTKRLPLAPNGASLYWAGLNQAKRSIEIDTRTDEGRQLVGRLLGSSGPDGGILLTNAVGQGWLDYEALRVHHDDLIHVHLTGHSDGEPAVDYTINAEVGLPLVTGPAMLSQPVNHVLPSWDLLAGAHAAMAILAAERDRHRTGRGRSITLSLADVAAATMAHLGFVSDVVVNDRGRLRDGNYLYGTFGCDFATSDGQQVMVVALTPRHWKHLLGVTRLESVVTALESALDADLSREEERYKHREVLAGLLRHWFESRTFEGVAEELGRSGVLWGPYRTIDQLVRDPSSLLARSPIFADVEQPGIGSYPAPSSVLRSGTGAPRVLPSPSVGQHTGEVLEDLAELDSATIAALRERGVIGRGGT
jgi:2-methylfumaryl-CoA isomerase